MKSESWCFLYPDKLLADTFHLSAHDFGAYTRALCWYYMNGPLPNDDATLRLIMRVEPQEWARCKGLVMPFFTLNGDGKFHQKRADHEIQVRNTLTTGNRSRTAAARAARWATHSATDTVTKHVTESDKITYRGEYDRILEKMRGISGTYAGHQTWRDEDKRDWARLKARRNELRELLGIQE